MSATSALKCTAFRTPLVQLHARQGRSLGSCFLGKLTPLKLALSNQKLLHHKQRSHAVAHRKRSIAPACLRTSGFNSSPPKSLQCKTLGIERGSHRLPFAPALLSNQSSGLKRSFAVQAKASGDGKEENDQSEGSKDQGEGGSSSETEAEAVAAATAAVLADVSGDNPALLRTTGYLDQFGGFHQSCLPPQHVLLIFTCDCGCMSYFQQEAQKGLSVFFLKSDRHLPEDPSMFRGFYDAKNVRQRKT